jgi:hypothetical protein
MTVPPPIRQFSANQRRLRDEWFRILETTDSWIDKGPIGEGVSQSIRVCNPIDNMMGAAKPGPGYGALATHCVAAHERIAFGLAYLAALPVAAVVLWPEGIPVQYPLGRSISSWAFSSAMKWSEADRLGLITPQAKASVAPVFAMMRVFHTWIGDTDRKGDHIIIDLDSPPGDLGVAFIDHGHSLSLNWGAWNAPAVPVPHYLADVPPDNQAMIDAAEYISTIQESEVSQFVKEIPAAYLPEPREGTYFKTSWPEEATYGPS